MSVVLWVGIHHRISTAVKILFEEGMNLVNQCQSQLRKAEQRVENLIAGSKDTNIEDEL